MRSIMILGLLVLSGVSAMPEDGLRERLLSEELRLSYSENSSEDLAQQIVRAEAREHMLQQALFYAGRSAPVDNRAYLFTLAIDLYHSLPPGPDPSGYEPGELGGKGEWMRLFQYWPDRVPQDLYSDDRIGMKMPQERDRDWERLLRLHEGQPGNLAAAIETQYIRYYFEEHIQLDHFIQHASLEVGDLSFLNPTHYAALSAYLKAMRDRIRAGIPPWEEPTKNPEPVTSGSPLMSVPTTETAEPVTSFETPAPEKPSGMPLLMLSLLKFAIGALLIVAIVAFMIRRGRRK